MHEFLRNFVSRLMPQRTMKPTLPTFPETKRKTPNVSARKIKPTHILLHHTSGAYKGSVAWCCDPVSKVSYHCIIARDGRRTVLAEPTARTWHAGRSEWQGRNDCNSFMVGIAWEGDTKTDPLEEAALQSACEYLLPIIQEHGIPIWNIVRHADVATGRKDDCSIVAARKLRDTITKYG